jgi:hypothetical protein
MSSALVVAAVGHAASTPRGPAIDISTSVVPGARHAASTPRGPANDIFNFGGDPLSDMPPAPLGAHHRCLQIWLLSMPDLPLAPPRGPAIDIFNFGGGRCWTYRQHPQGPTIDVLNFSGGHYQTYCQHP